MLTFGVAPLNDKHKKIKIEIFPYHRFKEAWALFKGNASLM
jgi:hypothetical protein